MYKIQTLNKISAEGLALFPRDNYEIASEILNPDAILVRSAEMGEMALPETVKAVARAGAGVNNIPVAKYTEKGIVVFNTPGANANAVKELVIAAILFSSRPVHKAALWAKNLAGNGDQIPDMAEKGKSQFVGPEIKGKTLGVIGLGAIGAMVANDAIGLGMNVVGYDPFISVDSAWSLSRAVHKAESLDALLAKADYLTIHVPQTNDTKGFINADKLRIMKKGVRILNFARGGLVNNADMIAAIMKGRSPAMSPTLPTKHCSPAKGLSACPTSEPRLPKPKKTAHTWQSTRSWTSSKMATSSILSTFPSARSTAVFPPRDRDCALPTGTSRT